MVQEDDDAQLTLIGVGVGAELSHALDAAVLLRGSKGTRCRVVSFPCLTMLNSLSGILR